MQRAIYYAAAQAMARNMFNIHAKLILMCLLWATSYPLGRYLADYEAPEAIVAVRALIAAAFLFVVAQRRREAPMPLRPALLGQLLALGVFAFCMHNFLMFKALEHTQANTGAVINGAIPIVVMVFDFIIFRRTIARWSVLGVAVSFVGTVLVVSHGDPAALLQGRIGYGEFLFLIAITGWAFYTITARPLLGRYPVTGLTAWSCLAGGVLMVPPMLLNLDAAVALLSSPLNLALMVAQGILTLGLGFLWYYEGIHELGPMNAAVYINLVPIFGVVLAALTIGEVPSLPLLVGGALVVGGLLVVNRAELHRQRRLAAIPVA